jgi:hypothetical protein
MIALIFDAEIFDPLYWSIRPFTYYDLNTE